MICLCGEWPESPGALGYPTHHMYFCCHYAMKNLVRFALLSLAFVLSGIAFGQSNLPACTETNFLKRLWNGWSDCVGESTYASGDKYVGEFKDGKRNGQGTYYFLADNKWKGDQYVGEFKDGLQSGKGTYHHLADDKSRGDKYVGEFKDGKRNGQGPYYFLAENKWKGNQYVGEFKDGEQTGQGVYYHLANNPLKGYRVVGEWYGGKINGRAIIYLADGEVSQSGIYQDGKLVSSQYIDPNNFTRIAKSSDAPAVNDAQRLEAERLKNEGAQERQRLAEGVY